MSGRQVGFVGLGNMGGRMTRRLTSAGITVAAQFHMLWNKGRDEATLRFILASDPILTRARLALVRGVALVIASGLAVIGVTPVEEM